TDRRSWRANRWASSRALALRTESWGSAMAKRYASLGLPSRWHLPSCHQKDVRHGCRLPVKVSAGRDGGCTVLPSGETTKSGRAAASRLVTACRLKGAKG